MLPEAPVTVCRKPPFVWRNCISASSMDVPFFTKRASSCATPSSASATIICTMLSALLSPIEEKPPSVCCLALMQSSASCVAFATAG